METPRIDRLARFLAATPTGRRQIVPLVTGLVLGWRQRTAAAQDETSVAVADSSGGNGTLAGTADPARRSRPGSPPEDDDDDDRDTCKPASREERCGGRCGREVGDGCGGQIQCSCPDGERCGPGDRCCPAARLCLASDVCCPETEVCAPGGGVCCSPAAVCEVGGVVDACCQAPGLCVEGVCQQPAVG